MEDTEEVDNPCISSFFHRISSLPPFPPRSFLKKSMNLYKPAMISAHFHVSILGACARAGDTLEIRSNYGSRIYRRRHQEFGLAGAHSASPRNVYRKTG